MRRILVRGLFGVAMAALLGWIGSNVAEGRQDCVTGFDPPALNIPAAGGAISFTILTSSSTCSWTWTGPFTPWVHLPSSQNGVGSQTVSFPGIQPNEALTPRSVEQMFGGLPIALTQAAAPCTLTVTPPSMTMSVNGGTGSFSVTSDLLPCSYTTLPDHFVTITSGGDGNQFPGIVSFSIPPNPTMGVRVHNIQVSSTGGFPVVPRFRITQNGPPVATDAPPFSMHFAVHRLAFGPPFISPPEPLRLSNAEDPGSPWTATTTVPWLVATPASGSGPGVTTVAVDAAAAARLPLGSHEGFVEIATPSAPTFPRRIHVVLKVTDASSDTNFPLGHIDLPVHDSTVSGAFAVSGWALDDVGIARVEVFRERVDPEPPGTITFIGFATRIRGARPDITASDLQQYQLPEKRAAGWGLMVLSNVLPNGGFPALRFYAYAVDIEGNRASLPGAPTVLFNNHNAVKPFGTIDFPDQGGTVSGTIAVEGWVLAQPHPGRFIPFDGSTIRLFIDDVEQPANATYGVARPDVAALFPPASYANANGPGVRFTVDTTQLADGLHTIAWVVTDNMGAAEGIGSRFFTVQNGGN